MADRIRIVIAGNGRDDGAEAMARALRDAGVEVVYTGGPQQPEQIVATVVQEDADAVGLPGGSDPHRRAVAELLAEQDASDVLVFGDEGETAAAIVARLREDVATATPVDSG